MEEQQVISTLESMGKLLELNGANVFKVRAFQNAARSLSVLDESLEVVVKEGRHQDIKGVGKNIAAMITELFETGMSADYEELQKMIPSGVVEMLAVPGLGAKKIRKIWQDLEVASLDDLESACGDGRVAALDGFGEKTARKILSGIEQLRSYGQRHLISEVQVVAEQMHAYISEHESVHRCEIAGSLRRHRETIKDIDLVVSTNHPEKVSKHIADWTPVESLLNDGETKVTVALPNGISADVRLVTDAQFPFALHHFTGSKEHNVAMRTHAKTLDLKMNEYGLFRGESKKSLVCKTEADIFSKLDMDFVLPEMRENTGEIEVALEKNLPSLIELTDVQGVLHNHSTYSDGKNSLREMVEAARSRGHAYFGISDHSQSAVYANGLKPDDILRQHEEIDRLRSEVKGTTILKAIESDILSDGSLDYNDEVLASFDYVIASIHSRFSMERDEMTKRICDAIAHPSVRILAHPTGRLLLKRKPYEVDFDRIFEVAAKHDVAIEMNASPKRLDLDWRYIRQAKEAGCSFVISPDAHAVGQIDNIAFGIGIARKGWLEASDVINTCSLSKLKKWMGKD